MLTGSETARWAAAFGVAPEQIAKDHLVSHVLAAMGALPVASGVVLFGGTGLARTHLPQLRLSEDVDLWGDPAVAWPALLEGLPHRLRREFPACRLERVDAESANLVTREGVRLRLQVVAYGAEYRRCLAVEARPVVLRYADLPDAVSLRVPTRAGFAAMKHLAWAERGAPRDLVDLAGLAALGALDREAARTVRCLSGIEVGEWEYRRVPDRTRRTWPIDLAHQMREVPDPDDALEQVRRSWGRALDWA